VFIDYLGIGSGSFEHEILENIAHRAHFLVMLTPSALARVDQPGDWLRREVECAIDLGRNVIPLLLEVFEFTRPRVQARLTGKLALLNTKYNGLIVPRDYFAPAMQRLERQFLNKAVDTVLHPVSPIAQKSASRQQVLSFK
jgi:hypothetical protein